MIWGTKTKIYCQRIICLKCVFAALRTVKLGLTEVGNQAKPLSTLRKKKVVFLTNLVQMFKRTATDFDIQPTKMQQRLAFELKNASLLADGCRCINDKGSEILFRINISPPLTTTARLDGAGQWLGLPGHRTSHKWTSSYGATLKSWFTRHHVILKKIELHVFLRQQQPSDSNLAFWSAQVTLCCVVVGYISRSAAVRMNICSKLVRNTTFFSEYFIDFAWFPTLVRSNLTVRSAARTHLRYTVPSQ